MTRGSLLTASTLVFTATIALSPRAYAANPTTAECVAAADSSLQLRDQHKLRAARAQMLVCASATCPAAIQSECLRRVDQTNAAIPTIVACSIIAGNDVVGFSRSTSRVLPRIRQSCWGAQLGRRPARVASVRWRHGC